MKLNFNRANSVLLNMYHPVNQIYKKDVSKEIFGLVAVQVLIPVGNVPSRNIDQLLARYIAEDLLTF